MLEDLPCVDDDDVQEQLHSLEAKRREKQRRIIDGDDDRIAGGAGAADASSTPTGASPNDSSLEAHEARWGFSYSELQAASKVVSVLFNNPALFVGDAYLAESRLYTMISRDRKTKRENKDTYKQVMNEEKSRRERAQRQQDIETVRKTAMKREREDALNALLLPPPPGEAAEGLAMLICDRVETHVDPQSNAAVAPSNATDDSQVWRMVASLEALYCLEQTLCTATSYGGDDTANNTSGGGKKPPNNEPKNKNSQTMEGEGSAVTIINEASSAIVMQFTALLYRLWPHEFGSQMPAPLFFPSVVRGGGTATTSVVTFVRSLLYFKGALLKTLIDLCRKSGREIPLSLDLACASVGYCFMPTLQSLRRDAMFPSSSMVGCCRIPVVDAVDALTDAEFMTFEKLWLSVSFAEHEAFSLEDREQVLSYSLSLFMARFVYPWMCEVAERHNHDLSAEEAHGRSWWDVESNMCFPNIPSSCVDPPTPDLTVALVDLAPPATYAAKVGRSLLKECCVRLPEEELRMNRIQKCHTCKGKYETLHNFYYSLCRPCGEFNYNKRLMTRDLRGKVVLLTGCRIKIGYAMCISLLRCGATLLGTTRFAHDALARFTEEPDYAEWQHRLHIFSLDLRDMWMVTQFCGFISQKFPKLFAIVNNAAQTIARLPEYTSALRKQEMCPPPLLREELAKDAAVGERWHQFFMRNSSVTIGEALHLEHHPDEHACPFLIEDIRDSVPSIPSSVASGEKNDLTSQASSTITSTMIRPEDCLHYDRYDTQAELTDLRQKNSWTMNMHEVQGSEAAEVMAINALSPFVLNSKLKPLLMNREGEADQKEGRFIINVSAMEGQFYRFKQTTHPHTNMAKAALNMMTRTSAEDYAQAYIYMNSVDTGWITDESPVQKKQRRADDFMLCPLDEVDAAARCLDLMYQDSKEYGKFWKDYHTIPW